MNHAGRLARLGERLAALEVDALVVGNLANIRYLTGFDGSNAALVVRAGGAVLLTDFRYLERSAPLRAHVEVRLAEREALRAAGEALAGGARAGFERTHLTVASHELLVSAAPGVELVGVTGAVEDLRAVKEPEEVEAIRRAAAVLEGVYAALAEDGLSGRTERDVAWRVCELFHAAGAEGPSFDTIVASADAGALPHAEPRDVPIPPGTLVTIDLGCVVDGYCSDCTRTFATEGDVPQDLLDAYATCLEAQLAGLEAVRPGASGVAVDGVARAIIAEAGHGEHFGHGLGHGVGLEVHEAPRLSPISSATLERGMIVTVEPGIYLPGLGGVRIEDLVVVTGDGCERLTGYPKELITTR